MKFYDLEMFGMGGVHTVSGTVQVADTFLTSQTADCIINGGILKILKNIKWNNTSFNSIGTTTFKFTGTNAQTIYGAVSPQLYKVVIDKNGGQVTLQKNLSVSNNIDLVNGYLITDTVNVLTLRSGATATSASGSSFVKGPIIKVGNSAFTFPVGKGTTYKPIAITAPSVATDAFRAEYFNTGQSVSINRDSLTYISKCEYWILKRTLGTSLVKVTLYWDNSTCDIVTTQSLKIARWDGGKWNNVGPVTISGTVSSGSMQSNSTVNALSYFTIGKRSSQVYSHAGSNTSISLGSTATLGGSPSATGGVSPYSYQWITSYALDNATSANPYATPFTTNKYYLRVSDADGSIGFDSVNVTVNGFDIKSVKRFPLLAQGSIWSLNCTITVEGAVGSGFSIDSIFASDSVLVNTSSVNLALRHADTAKTKISQLTATAISSNLNNVTQSPGIYRITGNVTLTDTLTLNGNSDSYFAFDINGSLTVNSGTIKLKGVNFNQVFFRVRDSLKTLGTAELNGIFLSGSNANLASLNGQFTLATIGYIAITGCGAHFTVILQPNLSLTARKCEDYIGNNGENIVKNGIGIGTGQRVDPGPPTKAPAMHPDLIRYPGGSISNWWNWQSGWFRGYDNPLYNTNYDPYTFTANSSSADARNFFDPYPLPDYAKDDLPWDNRAASPLPNTLQDLKYLTDGTAAMPIFALNLITSDMGTQIGELFKAHCLNLPIKYAELGNEFYLDGDETNALFETAGDYAQAAHDWDAEIKKYFPDIKTSAVAATTKNGSPDRRNEWNTHLFESNYMNNIDALTFHVYPSSGLKSTDGFSDPDLDNYDLTTLWTKVLPIVFSQPFVTYNSLETDNDPQPQLSLLGTYDKDGWITEFNLDDDTYDLGGRWAHSLFVGAMALNFLKDSKITHITFHTMIADAEKGGLFEDENGFGSGGPATIKYALAASGAGIRYIALAAKNARTAREITLPQALQNKGADNSENPGVYGWMFSSAADQYQPYSSSDSNIAVVLNLNSSTTFMYTNELFPYGGTYIQATQDPNYTSSINPLGYITGHSGEIKEISGTLGTLYSYIILPAFSITVIKNSLVNMPQYTLLPNVQVSNSSVCPGGSVTLYLSGGTEYLISPSATSINYSRPTATAIVNPSVTTTYTIQAIAPNAISGSVTVQINVGSFLNYSVSTSSSNICPGDELTLSKSGASGALFDWYPSEQNNEGTSVVVSPDVTTTYTVTATDGKCYCNEQTVTANVYPKADAGPDVYVCTSGKDDNHPELGGTVSYPNQTLAWSGGHISYLSPTTAANPVFTPPSNTNNAGDYTYTFTATPPSCPATTDQTTVHVLNCCTGSGTYYPFSDEYLQSGQSGSNYLTAFDLVEFLNGTYTYFTPNGISLDDAAEIKNYSSNITINGLFLINLNLTLNNCTNINFGPKAKIIIEPNCQLTISNGTQLKGCSGTWDGIDIEGNLVNNDGLIINTTGTSPVIKDATTAIFASRDSRMSIKSAIFQNNNQHLHLEDYRFGFDATVTDNTFSGSSTAGSAIYVNGISTFIFGDASDLGLANTISSSTIGIEAINSNVQSYGTTINMSSSNPASTYGIKITGGDGSKVNNNTIGFGSSVTNYTSGTTGLYIENATQFDVEQNEMDGVEKGMTLSSLSLNQSSIYCNTFNHNKRGFYLIDDANAGNIGASNKASNNYWTPTSGWYDGTSHGRWHTYNQSANGAFTIFFTTTSSGYLNSENGAASGFDPMGNVSPVNNPICTPPSKENEIDSLQPSPLNLMSVIPNPTKTDCTILFKQGLDNTSKGQLFDSWGTLIDSHIISAGVDEYNISLTYLPSALYFFKLVTQDGKIFWAKIAKIR